MDSLLNITVTEKAKKRLREYSVGSDRFLRVGVTSGGCSGHTFEAVIDTIINDGDEVVYDEDDVRIVTDTRSSLFLDGLNVDFSDDLIQSGFRLTNRNASQSCGCGASFSA